MTEHARAILARLSRPTDTAALCVFRFVLGALVTVGAVRFLAYGWVDELFTKPTFFFKYWGFAWVRPLPSPMMHVAFALLAALGVCFSLGLFFRVVAPLLFVLFTYVELVDVTNWLNHYYLVSVLLFLSALMPLGRAHALDARLWPASRLDAFPAWCTYALRFQVAVVYFYAGLAKLSSDWLVHAQPLNIWLHARTGTPVIGALFDLRATAYLFSWGGFLFDTTIALFLLWRRARPFAYVVVVGFHTMVGLLFPIGMFPFIMALSVLVFFEPTWPRRVLAVVGRVRPRLVASRLAGTPRALVAAPRLRPALAAALAAFCAVQALAPLRHRLYGGNVLWHEQGMRFSWRVMCREKNGDVTYLVDSKSAGRTWYVSPRKYLTDRQERELSGQPDLVLQLAHHIADDYRARGWSDVRVRAEAFVSLNGRSAAAMIDPTVDLSRVDDGLGRASWILPEPPGPPIHLTPWNQNARLAAR